MSPRLYFIMLLIVACTPTRRRTPDDTLVLAIDAPVTIIDPRYTISNYDAKVRRLVCAGLTDLATPTGEPALDLATRIDHPDPLTFDVELSDARFSDGAPVTGDDVARTYMTALDPACQSNSHAQLAERFTSVEATGPKSVRFHLRQPLGTFLTDAEFGIISFHGVPAGECHPDRVIGAGPYVLRELTSYAAYLDANPYYRDPPRLPHLEIRFVQDPAARILMLVGGSVDLLQNATQLDLVDDIAENPRVHVTATRSVLLTFFLMNNDKPPLNDRRVREAIAHAIDRRAIIEAKLGGRAVLATGLLPPTHWAYEPDVPRWDYDPAKSRALLKEAGVHDLHLTYKTSSDGFRTSLARLIASQLGEVGITVDVQPFEFATFFQDVKDGKFELASMQTTPITDPDFYLFYFASNRIPTDADRNLPNRSRYRSKELDRLVEEGRRETDPARRKEIYSAVQRLVATDVPVVPLWHEDNVVLSNVDVQGYAASPDASLAGLARASKSW